MFREMWYHSNLANQKGFGHNRLQLGSTYKYNNDGFPASSDRTGDVKGNNDFTKDHSSSKNCKFQYDYKILCTFMNTKYFVKKFTCVY